MEAAIVDAERDRHDQMEARPTASPQEKETVSQPTKQPPPAVEQAAAVMQSNVVQMAETMTTAAEQMTAEVVEKASSNLSDLTQTTKRAIGASHAYGSTLTQYAQQIATGRTSFSQRMFLSVAEQQYQLFTGMTKWWIRRNEIVMQSMLSALTPTYRR